MGPPFAVTNKLAAAARKGGTSRAAVLVEGFRMTNGRTDDSRSRRPAESVPIWATVPATIGTPLPDRAHEIDVSAGVVTGGSTLEALGGAVAVVLAIIGIAGVFPVMLGGVAAIVIGGMLFADGSALAARWKPLLERMGSREDRTEILGGVAIEVLAGGFGAVLGIIVLAVIGARVLLPIAALAFGCALIAGGAALPQVDKLVPEERSRFARPLHYALRASSASEAILGLAAVVLGILGIIGVGPNPLLSLVAMLCVGASMLLAGGTLAVRFGHQIKAGGRA
jgi:hypothetical protein